MMLSMYLIETRIVSHDNRIVNIRVRQQLNYNSLCLMNLSNHLDNSTTINCEQILLPLMKNT